MPMTFASRFAAILALATIAPTVALAQKPPASPTAPQAVKKEIKALPPVDIPDDPPPHEGAMITLPYTIDPTDIIVVEVLEALPGRPISGERLVRPDGKISLGFYGEMDVMGLTTVQVKEKLIEHLRHFLTEETLGLHRYIGEAAGVPALGEDEAMPGDPELPPLLPRRNPFDPEVKPPVEPPPAPPADRKQEPDPPAPATGSRPSASTPTGRHPTRGVVRFSSRQDKPPGPQKAPRPKVRDPLPERPANEAPGRPMFPTDRPEMVPVEPADSNRAFVDVTAYNSKCYYVQGDVGVPARLPYTGRETVLDALNYSGRLTSSADSNNIHLRRPARGSKPAKDYKIDLEAVHNGEANANLQLFPGDRLVVGRDPVVKASNDLDRLAAPMTTLLNQMFLYGTATRTLTAAGPLDYAVRLRLGGRTYTIQPDEGAATSKARQDAMMKEFVEVWSALVKRNGGQPIDERAFRDILMRRLAPAPEAVPEKK